MRKVQQLSSSVSAHLPVEVFAVGASSLGGGEECWGCSYIAEDGVCGLNIEVMD